MKCPFCGKDIFPGQFRCDLCGKIIKAETPKDTAEQPKKTAKEK